MLTKAVDSEVKMDVRQKEMGSKASANKSLILMLIAVAGLIILFVATAVILKMYM